MWRQIAAGLSVVAMASLVGCANVKVNKVDVEDRLAGNDRHVKGFRYYLDRPHVVVSRRVPVSSTVVPAALATTPKGASFGPNTQLVFVSLVPDSQGQIRIYDRQGQPRPDILLEHVDFVSDKERDPDDPSKQNATVLSPTTVNALAEAASEKVAAELISRVAGGVTTTDQDKFRDELKMASKKRIEEVLKEIRDGRKQVTTPPGSAPRDQIIALVVGQGVDGALTRARDLASPTHPILTAPPDIEEAKLQTIREETIRSAPAETSEEAAAVLPEAVTYPSPPRMAFAEEANQAETAASAKSVDPEDNSPSPFQVVFLPDFEEQYAIHNRNVLAKSQYRYRFENGTRLAAMAGSYSSVDVPVKILETVGKLVEAGASVAKTALAEMPVSAPKKADGARSMIPEKAAYYLRFEKAIEPGVYRMQKSWERAAQCVDSGFVPEEVPGLFGDLGLPLVDSFTILTADEHQAGSD